MQRSTNRVILVGLDGATWDLMGPWIQDGLLPNLARLVRQGASGDLRSTMPPNSAAAWTSMVTGKNPGKHGIYDFLMRTPEPLGRRLIHTGAIRSAKIWQILNAHGLSAGVINLPVLYPPEDVNGFMVSGMLAPVNSPNLTYPKELYDELVHGIGEYIVEPEVMDAASILEATQKRRDALFYLLDKRPTDFLMVVFEAPDRMQHTFWPYLDSTQPFYASTEARVQRDALLGCYALLDSMLGELLDSVDESTYVLVVSDHGFGPASEAFFVDNFLSDLGLLRYDMKKLAWEKLQGLRGPKNTSSNPVGRERGVRYSDSRQSYVDFQRTTAYASRPCEPMLLVNRSAINRGSPENTAGYDDVITFLKKGLLALRDCSTNEPLVRRVFCPEDVYSGPETRNAPDLLLEMNNPGCILAAGIAVKLALTRKGYVGRYDPPSGYHREDGIIVVQGKGIKPGRLVGTSVMDVAPTVLHLLGLAVPDDMDGSVLTESFDDDLMSRKPVMYCHAEENVLSTGCDDVYSVEDAEEVQRRLRALGYVD